jgi:FkbM family methyltransferase
VDRALLAAGRIRIANRHPFVVARNKLNTLLFRTVFTRPEHLTVRTSSGFNIVVALNDQGSASLLFGREYAPVQSRVLKALLRESDGFIDVGANYGYFSLLAATTMPGKKVIAVEPNPSLTEAIRESISANDIDTEMCVVLQQGVADKVGSRKFAWDARLRSSGRIVADGSDGDSIVVTITTIDSIIENSGFSQGAPLVKIDVEGFEREALHGGQSLFEHDALIMIEISRGTLEDVARFIADRDYVALDFAGLRRDLSVAPRTRISDYVLCPSRRMDEVSHIIKNLH